MAVDANLGPGQCPQVVSLSDQVSEGGREGPEDKISFGSRGAGETQTSKPQWPPGSNRVSAPRASQAAPVVILHALHMSHASMLQYPPKGAQNSPCFGVHVMAT